MSRAQEAATRVLTEAEQPLHYREITRRALDAGYYATNGKTPADTFNAQLSTEIQKKGAASRFKRVSPGVYALDDENGATGLNTNSVNKRPENTVSFTDAAEQVLQRFGNREPMHYRQITEKARDLGLIATSGRTPEASMYSSVLQETQRKRDRGEQPRFYMHGKGMIGLTAWMPKGLAAEIEAHNKKVRAALHRRLREMDPGDFEELIGQLLGELGFEEVEVTQRHGDGGIDVRGTLVVGEVIRTRMAVQVKRWKSNVQAQTVREVRGSLGAHEQGLIVTTSDFGQGATTESRRADAVPIGLMNGKTLVSLLVEHDIAVRRAEHELLELADVSPESAS
jgi:restriction system protein